MSSEMDDKKWLDDYMSLKQVNPVNPFTVPSGYFDELAGRVKSIITIDDKLKGTNAEMGFTVPDGYFNQLESNIRSRINIEKIAGTDATNFTVPDGYFEGLESNIQSRINIEKATGIDAASFTVPDGYFDELGSNIRSRINIEKVTGNNAASFTVPDGYFENLAEQVNSRIFIEETLTAKTDGFDVPAGYFEKMTEAVLLKTVIKLEPRKRQGIVKRMYASGAFKYATAACFVLAVCSIVFVNQYENPTAVHKRTYLHKALAKVDDADILDYLQMHMDAAETSTVIDEGDQINKNDVNSDDIKDYLGTN